MPVRPRPIHQQQQEYSQISFHYSESWEDGLKTSSSMHIFGSKISRAKIGAMDAIELTTRAAARRGRNIDGPRFMRIGIVSGQRGRSLAIGLSWSELQLQQSLASERSHSFRNCKKNSMKKKPRKNFSQETLTQLQRSKFREEKNGSHGRKKHARKVSFGKSHRTNLFRQIELLGVIIWALSLLSV